jgi:hypothetical protein
MMFTLCLFAAVPGLDAQQLRYNGGMSYSSGSYFFGKNTGSFYLNNGLNAEFKRFSFSVNVPFVVQSTPWISYSPGGGIPTGGMQNGQVQKGRSGNPMGPGHGRHRQIDLADTVSYTRASFSDPTVRAGFRLYSGRDGRTALTMNGNLKIPLSKPSYGYGTGARDGGAGLSVMQRAGFTWMFFADATWWWFGNMDELKLKNSLAFGAGIGKIFPGSGWMINTSLNGFTTILDSYDPPLNLSFGAGYRVHDGLFLNALIGFGLSESSPGVSGGLGWSVKL